MQCRDLERYVDSFVDGEFAEPERLELEAHLSECAGCQRLVQEHACCKATLRAAAPRPLPSPLLSGRVRGLLDEEDRRAERDSGAGAPWASRASRAFVLWAQRPAVSRAALVASAVGLGLLLLAPAPQRRQSPVVLDSIVKHQRNLPLEITGGPEVVRSWFDGKVPFLVRAPKLEPSASLRGGRLVSLGNREAAYLIYERKGDKISVFVFDAHDLPMPIPSPRRQWIGQKEVYLEGTRGYHVAVFRDDELGYAITGTLDEPELIRLITAGGVRR